MALRNLDFQRNVWIDGCATSLAHAPAAAHFQATHRDAPDSTMITFSSNFLCDLILHGQILFPRRERHIKSRASEEARLFTTRNVFSMTFSCSTDGCGQYGNISTATHHNI
jgi:hypothetical protein